MDGNYTEVILFYDFHVEDWRKKKGWVVVSCVSSVYENLIGLYDILEDMNILFLDLIAHPIIPLIFQNFFYILNKRKSFSNPFLFAVKTSFI